MRLLTWIPGFLALFCACSIKPEAIHYGEDNCIHCQMTIMDHRYGTEIVTHKGKVYKFDSVECLLEFAKAKENKGEHFSLFLFTPFDRPGNLADARACHVLHSRNLPSPMGMYLTAFGTEAAALQYKDQYGGRVYSWQALQDNFQLLKLHGPGE